MKLRQLSFLAFLNATSSGMVKFRMMLKDSYGHPSQKDLAVVWKMKGNQYCLYDTWLNHVDMPGLTKTITEILDENHGFI